MAIQLTPLDYETVLTLDQANNRLNEVKAVFTAVKKKYSGFFSKFKKTIDDGDNKILGDCIGVLLPLSMQQVVQEEAAEKGAESILIKSSELQQEIFVFLARFENTGVEVFYSDGPFGF